MKQWMSSNAVDLVSYKMLPTSTHTYLPPVLHYGIKLPQRAILEYAKEHYLKRGAEGLVNPTSHTLQYRMVQTYTLLCVERQLNLPPKTLTFQESLSGNGTFTLSFLTNYTPVSCSREMINAVIRVFQIPDEQLRWWLGDTGAWRKKV
jgi:hypothetical protein